MKKKILIGAISLTLTSSIFFNSSYAVEGEKIVGKDRVETAIELMNKSGRVDTVILASGDNNKLYDSLVFAPLSKKINAPILLNNDAKKIDDRVKKVLINSEIKNVIIAGGDRSIGKEIEKCLKQTMHVERIYGKNRVETSLKVAEKMGDTEMNFIVSKSAIADAVSVSPLASILQVPIVIEDNTSNEVLKKKKENIVIGGENSIPELSRKKLNARRISGLNRYDTNKEIYNIYKEKFHNKIVYITSGEDRYLVDTLVVGPLAAKTKSPVIFTSKENDEFIRCIDYVKKIIFIGGKSLDSEIYKTINKKNKSDASSEIPHSRRHSINSETLSSNEADEKNKEVVKLEKTTGLPEKFDLRNSGGKTYVTPVKNQFYDGGCRSFASIAALESHIKVKENIEFDLSENNMENRNGFVFKDNNSKVLEVREGRNRESDFGYLLSDKGPILESQDPYIPMTNKFNPAGYLSEENKEKLENANKNFKSRYTVIKESKNPVKKIPIRRVHGFEFLKSIDTSNIVAPDDIAMKQIKEAIMENGAVVCDMYMKHDGKKTFPYSNQSTFNPKTAAYYTSEGDIPNHAVAIVGWDDNFKKEKFCEGNRPDIDGAWIVKDAQTDFFGDSGYFYVSFKSKGMIKEPYVFTDVRKIDEFKGMYFYDELPFTGYLKSDSFSENFGGEGKTVLFNRYNINENNHVLDSVGFFTTKPNAKYEVYIIKDFDKLRDDASSMDEDEFNKSIEENCVLSGMMNTAGYHTLELKDKLSLVKGNDFALGIYVKNSDEEDPDHKWDMVVETDAPQGVGIQHGKNAQINKNETFAFAFGEFVDINAFSSNKINACIRGYYK